MAEPLDINSSPPATCQKHFGPSERIAELNDIDRSISVLLSSAAEAVGVLSNAPLDTGRAVPASLPSVQAKFTSAVSSYFSTLSAIEVRLRRQVYALEEAGLIAAGDEQDVRKGRAIGGDTTGRTGGGPLDTSWLNARADDKVEFGMKRKLVDQAKAFLESVEGGNEKAEAGDMDIGAGTT